MNFGLTQIDTTTLANSGVEMTVQQPGSNLPVRNINGDPVKLRLLGTDSEHYQQMEREATLARVQAAASNPGLSEDALRRQENRAIEVLVMCTVGWSGVVDMEGQEIAFSASGAEALYRRYPAIRDQVDRFIATRANFLLGSATA